MKRLALSLLCAAALSGCRLDLPLGDKTSPDYWADVFLDLYADELVVGELEAGPEPLAEPRVVLLVTGVTIRAEWFDPIVARLERDGFVPVVYEPPELLSYDLFQASEDLAEVVERVAAESGQDKIDILAECTGGVIARHYIQSLGGDAHVSRMVTFVSPQNGIDAAPIAAEIAGWPALRDLSPGSEFLRAVNEAPLPENVPFTSIYTCGDEYINPYQTAIIPGATNIGLCDEFVGHFQTFYDPEIYLVMHGALTAPLPGAEAEADEVPAPPQGPAAPAPPALDDGPEGAPVVESEPEAGRDWADDDGVPEGEFFVGEGDPAPAVVVHPGAAAGCDTTEADSAPLSLLALLGLALRRRRD